MHYDRGTESQLRKDALYTVSELEDEAEALRLNPKLSVKWLMGGAGTKYFLQPWIDALRKAGLPDE